MDSIAARRPGGVIEGFYKLVMRRNSVYFTFIIAGVNAFWVLHQVARVHTNKSNNIDIVHNLTILSFEFTIWVVDYGVKKIWENNNIGKRYEDISVLGQRPIEE